MKRGLGGNKNLGNERRRQRWKIRTTKNQKLMEYLIFSINLLKQNIFFSDALSIFVVL
jgi:hypothetical protein